MNRGKFITIEGSGDDAVGMDKKDPYVGQQSASVAVGPSPRGLGQSGLGVAKVLALACISAPNSWLVTAGKSGPKAAKATAAPSMWRCRLKMSIRMGLSQPDSSLVDYFRPAGPK